jgi:hypothetical protein
VLPSSHLPQITGLCCRIILLGSELVAVRMVNGESVTVLGDVVWVPETVRVLRASEQNEY